MLRSGKGDCGDDDDVGSCRKVAISKSEPPPVVRKKRKRRSKSREDSKDSVIDLIHWVKVSHYPTGKVRKTSLVSAFSIPISGNLVKVVQQLGIIYFVPKLAADLIQIGRERRVKIGGKFYQARLIAPKTDPDFPKGKGSVSGSKRSKIEERQVPLCNKRIDIY